MGRCQDLQGLPPQLSATDIADVVRDNRLRSGRHRKLDQMIVRLVGQVGTPSVVQRDPAACTRQGSQNLQALFGRGEIRPDGPPQQILIFQPLGIADHRHVASFEHASKDLPRGPALRAQRRHEHVGVKHDRRHR